MLDSPDMLLFFYLSIRDANQEHRRSLEEVLGVHWTPELVHAYAGLMKEDGDQKTKEEKQARMIEHGVKIPLSIIINGTKWLQEMAKSMPLKGAKQGAGFPIGMGDTNVGLSPDEEVTELTDASKEAFFKIFGLSGIYGRNVQSRTSEDDAPKSDRERAEQQGRVDGPDLEGEHARESTPITEVPVDEFKRRLRALGIAGAPMEKENKEDE